MKTIEVKVYEYDELDKKGKERALREWRETSIPYCFLEDDMKEKARDLLQAAGIEVLDGFAVYYSLSYCQGDGAMIEGTMKWDGDEYVVKQSGHYYHYNSKTIDTEDGDVDAFNEVYVQVCLELERYGYKAIEDMGSEERFREDCEANDWTFEANGKMRNA